MGPLCARVDVIFTHRRLSHDTPLCCVEESTVVADDDFTLFLKHALIRHSPLCTHNLYVKNVQERVMYSTGG